jgi:hypothetical protein
MGEKKKKKKKKKNIRGGKSSYFVKNRSTAILVLEWNGEGFEYKQTLVAPAPILSTAVDACGNIWASLDPVDDKSDLVTVFIQNNGQVS